MSELGGVLSGVLAENWGLPCQLFAGSGLRLGLFVASLVFVTSVVHHHVLHFRLVYDLKQLIACHLLNELAVAEVPF